MEKNYVSALRSIDKSNELGNKMNDQKKILISQLQKEIVSFVSGKSSDLTSVINMEKDMSDKEQKALYYYELWNITEIPNKAKYKSLAVSMYRELFKDIPKYEYKQKINELS